jgi:hypothetical protein
MRAPWAPNLPGIMTAARPVVDGVIHILGIAIAIGGAAVLAVIAVHQGDITELTAIAIYLVALLAMFGFSAAYNLWPVSPLKWWLRRLDHSAIYLLIAATYTAFLLPMRGTAPTVVLIVIWSVRDRRHCDQATVARPLRPHRCRPLSLDGLERRLHDRPHHRGAGAGNAMAHRCRRRALFCGRHLSRLEQPAFSERDLARLRACRGALPLRRRADVTGHVTRQSNYLAVAAFRIGPQPVHLAPLQLRQSLWPPRSGSAISAPRSARRFCTVSSLSPLFRASASLSMIAFDVPLGANNA